MAVLVDIATETYDSKIEQELHLIQQRIRRLRSILVRYDRDKLYRSKVRPMAVVISIISFILLFLLAMFGPKIGFSVSTLIPVLQIPLVVLLWSAIGSFTSMVYRFNTASDLELQDPLRWLVTRPLTGIVMGVIAFLVVKVGLLSTASDLAASIGTTELMWLIAFLAGFSDRFSEGILRNTVGRLGGDKSADLFTHIPPASDLDIIETSQTPSKKKPSINQRVEPPQPQQGKSEPSKTDIAPESEQSAAQKSA